MSSRFPVFHYLFVTSFTCSRLRLSPLLFVTPDYATIYALSLQGFHCFVICLLPYVIALFSDSAVSSSVCYVAIVTISKFTTVSLSVCYVTALFSASIVPSSVCYLVVCYVVSSVCYISSRFPCFIICLLRVHWLN